MNILIFCPNWVGDAVMATPALRALRRHFSGARILGVMRPLVAQVLEGLSYFDAQYLWAPGSSKLDERTGRLLGAIRHEHSDLAVLLTNSFRSAAVAWLGGAARRVGYRRDGRRWLLSDSLLPATDHGQFVPTPAIDYYLQLAYYLGCAPESYRMDLATTGADERLAEALWHSYGLQAAHRVLLLNPGAAYGSAKCWPPSHFAQLARCLVRMPGTAVLVVCGPAERAVAREIVKRADSPAVQSLADWPISIGLSKACVRRSDLLITTDSGPRHFAAAFDVPVITLFGPTEQRWSETYFAGAIHLQKDVPCGPCQLRECPLDHRCMRELLAEEVLGAAQKLLERSSAVRNVA